MQITTEQAFNNLVAVAEKFIGTKQEHIAIEQSLNLIKEKLFKDEIQTTSTEHPAINN
jgi:hypothetical protein